MKGSVARRWRNFWKNFGMKGSGVKFLKNMHFSSVRRVRWSIFFRQVQKASVGMVRWLKKFHQAEMDSVGKVRWLNKLRRRRCFILMLPDGARRRREIFRQRKRNIYNFWNSFSGIVNGVGIIVCRPPAYFMIQQNLIRVLIIALLSFEYCPGNFKWNYYVLHWRLLWDTYLRFRNYFAD